MLSEAIHPAPNLTDAQKLDWLRLIRTDNVGPITFYRLIERYGSATKALERLPDLSKRGGKEKPLNPPPTDIIEQELENLYKIGGKIICACDINYPLSLSHCEDSPPVLSVLGDHKLLKTPCLAIVGARNASLNGKKFAGNLARDLGQAGQTIVSGMARGIDTAAHAGSLNTGTIAVLAGGINIAYPSDNQQLYDQIKSYGCIVAESPFGTEPIARLFPKRNRIISGLSSGIIVVEATLRSGSLITARMAGEQGRDVYAVPGYPGDPRASGPNKLIQDGALLVQSSMDVLQNIGNYSENQAAQDSQSKGFIGSIESASLSENEAKEGRSLLLENLSAMPVSVDELVRTCQIPIPALQTILLELELAGHVKRLPGGRVALYNKDN